MVPGRGAQILVDTSSVVVNATGFPVVLMSFVGAPSRPDFTAFLAGCSRLFDRHEPFVAVVDAREGGVLAYEQVLDAATWLEDEDRRRRAYCRGIALVLPGTVQRAVLAAILRVCPFDAHAVFGEVPAAVSWALRTLAKPVALDD